MQVRLMILLVWGGGGRTFEKFDISTIVLVFTTCILIEYKFGKTANLTLYAWY